MTVAYASFVVGVLVVCSAGLYIHARTPTKAGWVQNLLGRLGRVRDVCMSELGRYGGAFAVLLASAAAAFIVCWPFGRLARRFRPQIDGPFLRWTLKHSRSTGAWHHINAVLTNMGNRPVIEIVVPVAAVVLAALWAKRGFWIPPLVIMTAWSFEKFGQAALAKVVARPPVSLPHFGTYPSGGCARLIVIYGTIVYLILLTWPSLGRRWRVAGFTAVGVLASVEGYTRIYLIKHWGMDVVGGLIWGTLILLSVIGATSCLKPDSSPRQPVTPELVHAGGSPS